ncbi:DUF418 domain-containing protein [Sphingomonas sp. ZT3P38]|uniref:DUF418 domain-containing protein n=1 Tax=Parasphingomonas zepuensis TaxID=3096161 RepID=UPI002FCBDDD4
MARQTPLWHARTVTIATAFPTIPQSEGAARLVTLDILRGLAILGILFMNVDGMGASIWGRAPGALGWSPPDQIAWWLRQVLSTGTARGVLEMLFGAGLVILTDRFARTGGEWQVMKRYYGRTIILFLFGLVHAFILLWPGDILHIYAMAALLAFLFRRLKPRWLLALGLSCALFKLVSGGIAYHESVRTAQQLAALEAGRSADRALLERVAESKAQHARSEAATRTLIAAENKARSGSFMSWAGAQWHSMREVVSRGMYPWFIWAEGGCILIGAALFKLGILQGNRSRRYYLWLFLCAYAVAGGLRIWEGWEMTRFSDAPQVSAPFHELARLVMTLGHVAFVNWLVTRKAGAVLLQPFVAAGRTALSLYILQTIICLWILFPPFALGLYGKMTLMQLMLTATGIDLFLLLLANLYVRRFDIGPVEWAWRSIDERRPLPWRRRRLTPIGIGLGGMAPQ